MTGSIFDIQYSVPKIYFMETLKLQKPWALVKELLKEINGDLTDEDLIYEKGKEEELFTRLQKKINMDKEELKGWIESVSYNEGKAS